MLLELLQQFYEIQKNIDLISKIFSEEITIGNNEYKMIGIITLPKQCHFGTIILNTTNLTENINENYFYDYDSLNDYGEVIVKEKKEFNMKMIIPNVFIYLRKKK